MAALQVKVNIPSKSCVTATATVVAFVTTPANQRVRILGYSLCFDGTTNAAAPVEIRMCVSSGTGTFTSGSNGQLNEPELTETIQSVYGIAASVEPTYTAAHVTKTITVHPQLSYEFLAPFGQEQIVPGAKTFAITINAPATVNVRGYLMFEE